MSARRVRTLFTAYGAIVILAGLFCLGFAIMESFGAGCGYDAMADGSHVDLGCTANGVDTALASLGIFLLAGGAGGLLLTRRLKSNPLPRGEGGARAEGVGGSGGTLDDARDSNLPRP